NGRKRHANTLDRSKDGARPALRTTPAAKPPKAEGSCGCPARAVVGYCDGKQTYTFSGETTGFIADTPRGSRDFYWDVVFCPDEGAGMTYAEISDQPGGLQKKIAISQSTKAISAFASFLSSQNGNGLFD
ncbi:non-canonical purine NTP pyrophosphatase, partial [Aurantimonas coralicida]|uniref:non-canonical purine NTP pyrophosphatase n=1 Tax=Aurantimonas coralicida TaxID=182270 RepID=UPI0022A8FA03